VLRWQGRPRAAESALRRALGIHPHDGDAAEQMRWLRADLVPAVAPAVTYATDSDPDTARIADAVRATAAMLARRLRGR
jgi:hypothetical protein